MSDVKLTQADANSLARGAPRMPAIPSSFGTDPKEMIGAIKEIIEVREGQRGSKLDKALTWRDLFDQGVIALNIDGQAYYTPPAGGVVPAPANNGSIDQTPPPAPTGLQAVGALASIILSWDRPTYGNNAHAYTEIWSNATDDLGTAQLIGTSPSQVYVDQVGSGAVRYYWIRWVSKFPVTGPFNKTSGTKGETGYDASYLIDVLKANPPPGVNYNPLLWVNADPNLVVNGVPVPLGTYMQAAYIADGSISRLKVGLAAIDDARIANLHAAKITAGDIDANRMRANIVQAVQGQFVSLSAITANLGTVTISPYGYLRTEGALTYGYGNGIYLGWDAGTYKFRLGDPGGGHGLFWNGSTLRIVGDVYSTGDGTFRGTFYAGGYTGFMQVPYGEGGAYIGQDGFSAGIIRPNSGDPLLPGYIALNSAGRDLQLYGETMTVQSRQWGFDNAGAGRTRTLLVNEFLGVNGDANFNGRIRANEIVTLGNNITLTSSTPDPNQGASAYFIFTTNTITHKLFYCRVQSGAGIGRMVIMDRPLGTSAEIQAQAAYPGSFIPEGGYNGIYGIYTSGGSGGDHFIHRFTPGTYYIHFLLLTNPDAGAASVQMVMHMRDIP